MGAACSKKILEAEAQKGLWALHTISLYFFLPMVFQVINVKILKTAVGFPAAISQEESISHKSEMLIWPWPLLSEGILMGKPWNNSSAQITPTFSLSSALSTKGGKANSVEP